MVRVFISSLDNACSCYGDSPFKGQLFTLNFMVWNLTWRCFMDVIVISSMSVSQLTRKTLTTCSMVIPYLIRLSGYLAVPDLTRGDGSHLLDESTWLRLHEGCWRRIRSCSVFPEHQSLSPHIELSSCSSCLCSMSCLRKRYNVRITILN